MHEGHFQLQGCSGAKAGRREDVKEKDIEMSDRYAKGNRDCQIKGSSRQFTGVLRWSSELFRYDKAPRKAV